MDKVLVNVYVPAAGQDFDVLLPRGIRISEVTYVLPQMLSELSNGKFNPSDDVAVCSRDSGALLNVNITVDELDIKNGTRLMII